LPQTTVVPDNHITSAVDHSAHHSAHNAYALPISSTVPHESESTAAQSSLPQTATVPNDHIISAVDHVSHNADAHPISSTVPHKSESIAAQSSLPQTTTIPDDRIASAVDHAAHNADAMQRPAGLDTGIAIIDAIAGSVGPVQSALEYAESLKGTLDFLAESAGYLNGLIGLVKDFADVGIYFAVVLIGIQFSHQIHPISKIAVGALTKVYDVSGSS
jgi:hypothetical protein